MPSSIPAGTQPERNVYSVSRLNREVRVLIERGLGVVWVEGELSSLSVPSSGHWYFSLKDRDAQLRCAMFRQRNMTVGFTPKVGQHVLARGRVSLYEPRGEYQFIVEHLEDVGVGVLKREFERLKAKLAAEGLFAQERKRSLPRFPRRIGVITSPTGAAIRDILHILARRFPPSAVLIYPTPVQGDAAVPCIIDALEVASARAECNVLIVARGGGSLEDLWAFNDERVARAIRASAIPVVCGIGHEIDFTIADFVADARAPTPSGAAELVVPDRNEYLESLKRTIDRLSACMRRELRSVASRFDAANARLDLTHPGVRLTQQSQRVDELEQRLVGAVRRELRTVSSRFDVANARLALTHPGVRLTQQLQRLGELEQRLVGAIGRELRSVTSRLNAADARLTHMHPGVRLTQQLQRLDELEQRLAGAVRRELRTVTSRLNAADARLALTHPGVRLTQQLQRLDELKQRLTGATRAILDSKRVRISEMFTRLLHRSPAHSVHQYRLRHNALASRLDHGVKECVSRATHRLELAMRALNTVSPLATLSRGFAVVNRVSDGALVTSADSVAVGEEVEARLAHGTLKARVTDKKTTKE